MTTLREYKARATALGKACKKELPKYSVGGAIISEPYRSQLRAIIKEGRDLMISDFDLAKLLDIASITIRRIAGKRTQSIKYIRNGNVVCVKRPPATYNRPHLFEAKDQPSPEIIERAEHCLALARLALPEGTDEQLQDLATRMGELLFQEIGHAPSRATTAPEVTQEDNPEPATSRGQVEVLQRIPSDARKLTLQQVIELADAIRPMLEV